MVADLRDGLNVFYTIAVDGIESLVEGGKRVTAAAAPEAGVELEFRPIPVLAAGRCGCPKCAQKLVEEAEGACTSRPEHAGKQDRMRLSIKVLGLGCENRERVELHAAEGLVLPIFFEIVLLATILVVANRSFAHEELRQ